MAGLFLNVKKTKAIWFGNIELNFSQKIGKLQTKLDMWSARDLPICGTTKIVKVLGLSQLVYSASNLDKIV